MVLAGLFCKVGRANLLFPLYQMKNTRVEDEKCLGLVDTVGWDFAAAVLMLLSPL